MCRGYEKGHFVQRSSIEDIKASICAGEYNSKTNKKLCTTGVQRALKKAICAGEDCGEHRSRQYEQKRCGGYDGAQ